ncbi:unnamed protein product [Phaedon cochleariae]|uniref:4'-phosphopantetheine phosphatase n=1 Tax=Phaedon cochleariae TaxID=80249 RepID=A0A9N9SIW2_PHACE|nr:unnamed protein product [Phaedon cochleariae]
MTGNENNNSVCPLLKNPDSYNPDTVDLINNLKARNYWLPCLEQMVKKFVKKAQHLNPNDPYAMKKAEACFQDFHDLVEKLSTDPMTLKPLSVRTLLEFHEDNLRARNLKDAWLLQKETESAQALLEFRNRIDKIDSISKFEDKWLEIIQGVLAGNVFDWGAKAVIEIIESSKEFGFIDALKTIERRPWFHDDFDTWLDRIKHKPHKSCVIFVDNSGVDFILGILPLARQLLSYGTNVVLTANSHPALNDVTFRELQLYCHRAAESCGIIERAMKERRLVLVENGQRGPCLDLSTLSSGLCDLMKSADLVIIEGMGRAVHTNLYAELTVDCFKLAVLKNEWLAHSLGAQQFSVICDFKAAT